MKKIVALSCAIALGYAGAASANDTHTHGTPTAEPKAQYNTGMNSDSGTTSRNINRNDTTVRGSTSRGSVGGSVDGSSRYGASKPGNSDTEMGTGSNSATGADSGAMPSGDDLNSPNDRSVR